jgi:hypothetical protein
MSKELEELKSILKSIEKRLSNKADKNEGEIELLAYTKKKQGEIKLKESRGEI